MTAAKTSSKATWTPSRDGPTALDVNTHATALDHYVSGAFVCS